MIKIRRMKKEDVPRIAEIHKTCFPTDTNSYDESKLWIECNFKGYPRFQYFVAEEEEVLGYILWMEKGGFRKESVLELEQIAVDPAHQKKGIGIELIEKSLPEMKKYLEDRGRKIKLIEVTTATDNEAQKLYKKIGAIPETIIKDFFVGDEVIMIKRFD